MNTRHLVLVVAVTGALAASACGKNESRSQAGAGTTGSEVTTSAAGVDLAAANTVYQERCSACHGARGRGDGPGAAALTPKPRNYTDASWQASVTDEQIKKTILLGGAAVGKSPIMPASPDLDSKPEVVEGLVKVVRKFGR
ncbi:MAG: c-type cytochrome [Labilithrix sp.]